MQCPEEKTRAMIMMSLDYHHHRHHRAAGQGEWRVEPKMGMLQEMSRIKKRMLMRNMDISFLVRIGSSCRWWTERMPSSSMTRRPGQGFNLTARSPFRKRYEYFMS